VSDRQTGRGERPGIGCDPPHGTSHNERLFIEQQLTCQAARLPKRRKNHRHATVQPACDAKRGQVLPIL